MIKDIGWGARWGLCMGVAYAVLAAIILSLKEELPRGVSPYVIVLSYPVVGVVAGMLVGILRPMLTSRRNAVWIGRAVGVVVMVLLAPLVIGLPNTWDPGGTVGIVIAGVILGGFAGKTWWDQFTNA